MAYSPNNPNGQATMANSAPVVIASNQTTIPVSLSGNQAVNLAQIVGTAASVGNGTTDAGTLRVSVSSDSTGQVFAKLKDAFGNGTSVQTVGDTMAAAPTSTLGTASFNLVYNGTNFVRQRGDATDGTLVNLGANNDVTVTSEVASTFDHGSNRDVDTAAEQITASSIAAKFGVLVKAANSNTGIIYTGNSDVTADTTDATDGFELGAGESVLIKVDNANKVYVIASANNQKVFWTVA